VTGVRRAWKAHGESMDAEPVTFEGFFEIVSQASLDEMSTYHDGYGLGLYNPR